jgi:hypothetical protein
MTNRQEVKLRMFNTVILVLLKFLEVIKLIPALYREFLNFQEKVKAIEALHPVQAADNKGITEAKNIERDDVAEMANILSGALYSYGTHKKDAELYEKMSLEPSAFSRANLADFIKLCNTILTECEKAGAALEDYGVSAETISGFKTSFESFKSNAVKPRGAIVEKSTATSTLEELFSDAEGILVNHIDSLILPFKLTNAQLYKEYQSARILEDRGPGSKKKDNGNDNSNNPK